MLYTIYILLHVGMYRTAAEVQVGEKPHTHENLLCLAKPTHQNMGELGGIKPSDVCRRYWFFVRSYIALKIEMTAVV